MSHPWPRISIETIVKELNLDRPLICTEIGVYDGEHANTILTNFNVASLILIDAWQVNPGYNGWTQGHWDSVYQTVLDRFKTHMENRQVLVMKGDSVGCSALLQDNMQDFVYIDADHSYTGCKRDIEAFWPKVRAGGFMAGHDYGYDGVNKAVHEFFGNKITVAENGTEWWIKK